MGAYVPMAYLRPPKVRTGVPEKSDGMVDTPMQECSTTTCYYKKGFSFIAESLKYERLSTEDRNYFP